MSVQEIRGIGTFSVFRFFFGTFLIVGLVAMLLVDLELIPSRMPRYVVYWRERFLGLDTVPKVIIGSLIAGVFSGLLATIMALIYNMFAALLGGIEVDIKGDDTESLS